MSENQFSWVRGVVIWLGRARDSIFPCRLVAFWRHANNRQLVNNIIPLAVLSKLSTPLSQARIYGAMSSSSSSYPHVALSTGWVEQSHVNIHSGFVCCLLEINKLSYPRRLSQISACSRLASENNKTGLKQCRRRRKRRRFRLNSAHLSTLPLELAGIFQIYYPISSL